MNIPYPDVAVWRKQWRMATTRIQQVQRRVEAISAWLRRLPLIPSFVPICLSVAVLLRFGWTLMSHPQPMSDFDWYYTAACTLAVGQGYMDNGHPTAYFPPGYPGLLGLVFALTGPHLWVGQLASILLQGGAIYFTYLLARLLFSSELVGRWTLLLYTLYPNHIAYSSLLSSEHLFVFMLLAGVWTLLRAQKQPWLYPLSGLAWGAATLTRPQAIFVPALIFLLLAVRERGLRRLWLPCILTYLALAACLLPWIWRNQRLFHHPIITTTTGLNLFIGNNTDANGTYIFTESMFDQLQRMSGRDWRDGADTIEQEYAFDAVCRLAAKDYLHAHPLSALARVPLKFVRLYSFDFDGVDWNNFTADGEPVHTLGLYVRRTFCEVYYLFLITCGLIALARGLPRTRVLTCDNVLIFLGLGIIGYFTTLYMVYYGMPRYHIPMMPWIIMYAALTLNTLTSPPSPHGCRRLVKSRVLPRSFQ